MRILVMGGTWFLGRYVVEGALQRGWDVTTFNRGKSGKDVPGVEAVHGDRTVVPRKPFAAWFGALREQGGSQGEGESESEGEGR